MPDNLIVFSIRPVEDGILSQKNEVVTQEFRHQAEQLDMRGEPHKVVVITQRAAGHAGIIHALQGFLAAALFRLASVDCL